MPLRGYPLILGQSDYSDSLVQLHDFGMPAFDRFGVKTLCARFPLYQQRIKNL